MQDCLFCSIANTEAEKLLWQNEVAAAFKDIHPSAPTHVLVVPKTHVTSLDELEDSHLAGELLMAVKTVAGLLGVQGAYQTVVNTGRAGGQVVDHLHFHIKSQQATT